MATKLELQQHINRLTAENIEQRERFSVAMTELENRTTERNKLVEENQFLRTKLSDADHRARKLIAQTNRQHGDSERRAQMAAARERAMKSGHTVLVGDNHV